MVFGIDLWYIIAAIVVILISMTLHEAMHAYVGYWLGDDTAKAQGRLTLNPLAHIDPFLTIGLPLILIIAGAVSGTAVPIFGGAKPVPFHPGRVKYGDAGAALIGIAGPLTNLLIAFIGFAAFALAGTPSADTAPGLILQLVIIINLGFFVFNMLPIPPLDGSRVLYALAPEGARRVMEVIEQYGIFIVFALVLVASPVIGAFMFAVTRFILGIFGFFFGVDIRVI